MVMNVSGAELFGTTHSEAWKIVWELNMCETMVIRALLKNVHNKHGTIPASQIG